MPLYNAGVHFASFVSTAFRPAPRAVSCALAAIFAALCLSSCIGPPKVDAAWITGDLNNRDEVEQRLNFINDGEPVILNLVLKNAGQADPAAIKTVWTFVSRRSIVYETEDRYHEPGAVALRLNRKAGDSENGKYKVEIELNGEPAALLYFIVGDELPEPMSESDFKKMIAALKGDDAEEIPPVQSVLSEFKIAKSVYGLTQAPKELGDVFAPDAPVIYLTMFLSQAPEGTKIRVDWFFLGDESGEERLIIPAELDTFGTRQLAFNMKPGTGDLPAGEYEARVYLNGEEFERVPFEVVEALEAAEPPAD